MENKDFKFKAFYNKDLNSYKFVLDYGDLDDAYCSIDVDNDIFISLGTTSNFDDEIYKKRKHDMLNSFLTELFGDKADNIIENIFTENIPKAFEKAEKFIIDNDIFVEKDEILDDLYESQEYELQNFDDTNVKENSQKYVSMCIYDEGIGSVDFYIKSKIYDDQMGIKINSDGSFYPIISTKYINLIDEAIELRKEVIKEFIYETLKVKINFGTLANGKRPTIPCLIQRAIEYAKQNGTIQHTDNNDDIWTYKDGEEKITELNGVSKI